MKWAFVCCAHKRAASPPMRCAKRKTISKTCGFAAGLPPTNLPLQKGELPRRKRRRSSKHPSSFFYNCFTTINCQNWGSYYMVSPNFGRNYNCWKIPIHLHKNRCVLEPLRFCAGVPFFVVGMWFLSFCRRHLRAQRARGVCGAHDTHIVEEEKVRAGQYL